MRPALAAALSSCLLAGAPLANAGELEVQVLDAAGRALADAVVFLESPAAQAAVRPAGLVEIAQVEQRFDPAVTVVPVGTAVNFPNRDKVRHHVYSFSPAKRFEIKLYVGTPASPVVFDRAGIAVLGCNIHDRMAAWVVIVPTPWYGKTDAAGSVRWADLPAGSYRLRAWHASLPPGELPIDQPLQVGARAQRSQVVIAGARP